VQVLDHVMVGIEGIAKERGHHLIRERFVTLYMVHSIGRNGEFCASVDPVVRIASLLT